MTFLSLRAASSVRRVSSRSSASLLSRSSSNIRSLSTDLRLSSSLSRSCLVSCFSTLFFSAFTASSSRCCSLILANSSCSRFLISTCILRRSSSLSLSAVLLACLKANSSAGGCDKSVSSEFSADLLGDRLGLRFLNGLFCFRNVREFIRGFASYENEFCLLYDFVGLDWVDAG